MGKKPIKGQKRELKEDLKKELIKEEESFLKKLETKIARLADSIERTRIDEYTSMLTRPWKFFIFNFVTGIFRGLGMAVGFTLIFALIVYVLVVIMRQMVDLPLIGTYIAEIVEFVNQYLQKGLPTR